MKPRFAHCRTAIYGLFALAMMLQSSELRADDPQNPPGRQVGLAMSGSVLTTTFNFKDAFTASVREKLRSGLSTRIVLQVGLEHLGKSMASWVRVIDIVYDLWAERFVVTISEGGERRQVSAESLHEAIELAGTVKKARLADTKGFPHGVYRLNVLVEVNPVSKEMVEEIQRWLARPPARKRGIESRTNFFGSFVGIFVDRRIGKADKSVTFTSQWFRLGKP